MGVEFTRIYSDSVGWGGAAEGKMFSVEMGPDRSRQVRISVLTQPGNLELSEIRCYDTRNYLSYLELRTAKMRNMQCENEGRGVLVLDVG